MDSRVMRQDRSNAAAMVTAGAIILPGGLPAGR
jgi:hypothetical protein